MKTVITFIAIAVISFVASGCTARTGVSVGHEGHRHGVAVKGSTKDGVSAGARAY